MPTKIKKWGNSLAVRLPKKAVDKMGLKEGSEVFLDDSDDSQVVIRKMDRDKKKVKMEDINDYIIPSNRKKENISGNIDKILYGTDNR